MKIAVQGQIVDIDTIYSISEKIYVDDSEYCFDINFFNSKSITVSINRFLMEKNEVYDKFNILRYREDQNFSEDEKITMKNLFDQIPAENKNRIEKMRIDIVNIWSSNQSVIPTFDFKKY